MSVTLLALLAAIAVPSVTAAEERDRYIIVLEDSVEHPGSLARAQAEQDNGKIGFVYRHALNGYSIELPVQAAERLRQHPKVKYVAVDGEAVVPFEELIETIDHEEFEVLEPTVPTGIQRTFATANKALDIDGVDDLRVDADVAVIDTGTSHTHADLNVVARTDCSNGTEKEAKCTAGSGTDANGHGTHVAGTIGAIDNGVGVVGMAPGARIWAVKVLGTGTNYMSEIIAGIDWITAKRKDANPENDIEVANMSLGCSASSPLCPPKPLDEAITKSVEAGVVHVVAAGNSSSDSKNFTPANSPDAITVSALADYDGKPEGKSSPTCGSYGLDDRLASFSNFGSTVELAAPGVCILSTVPSGYGLKSGTSMASPHVAGAAAILAGRDAPKGKADVEAITETLEKEGNLNWTDTSGDGIKEPLLDVSDESVFNLQRPPEVTTTSPTGIKPTVATLNGTVNPRGTATTYRFEYGKTTSYGTSVPIPNESVGSGNEAVSVSKTISGLSPETIYHYRVFAENNEGTNVSEDKTFTTKTLAPTFSKAVGTAGSGDGQFNELWGVAVSPVNGTVAVADPKNNRIQMFNEEGEFIRKFGSAGSGDGQFKEPYGVAFDKQGDVWVADTYNNRIQELTETGQFIRKFGIEGSTNGALDRPFGIVVSGSGTVWVADTFNQRVQAFSETGTYISKFSTSGYNFGIALDPGGDIWSSTTKEELRENSTAGTLLRSFSMTGSGVWEPRGIAVDVGGNIWVADSFNDRMQIFSATGEYLAKFGSWGSGAGQFAFPGTVALDPRGNVWITDKNNSRLQRWQWQP